MCATHSSTLLLDYTPANYFNLMSNRKIMNFDMKFYYESIKHELKSKHFQFLCLYLICNENIRTLNLIIVFFVKSNLKKSICYL